MKISERTSGVSLHFEKHKANDNSVNGLQRHNERVQGQGHKNENIDDKRTADNVFLKRSDEKFKKQVEKTINRNKIDGMKNVRKNSVRMVETTVQLSGRVLDQPEEIQEQVLRDSFEWLKNEFGEKNVISAVIHKDETHMHLHFDFVPITDDKRLSARDILTKGKLHQYQQDFLTHLQTVFPSENFERGGGDFKGLTQRDFEQIQNLIKQQDDEITQREDDLDVQIEKQQDRQLKFEHHTKQQENRINERVFKANQREKILDEREIALKGSFQRLEKDCESIDQEREKIDELAFKANQREKILDVRESALKGSFERLEREREKIDKKRAETQNILNEAVEEMKLVERLKNRLGNTWDNILKAVRNGALRSKEVEQTIPKKQMTYEDISGLNDSLLELAKKNKGRQINL